MDSSSVTALAEEPSAQATASTSGRVAHTVRGGTDRVLRHTVVALRAGAELAKHTSPGEVSLQVLQGRVRLSSPSGAREGCSGTLIAIPRKCHRLAALEDSVVLLSVVSP